MSIFWYVAVANIFYGLFINLPVTFRDYFRELGSDGNVKVSSLPLAVGFSPRVPAFV